MRPLYMLHLFQMRRDNDLDRERRDLRVLYLVSHGRWKVRREVGIGWKMGSGV